MAAWLEKYPPCLKYLPVKEFLAQTYPVLREKYQIGHDALRHSFCSYLGKLAGSGAAAQAAGHTQTIQMKNYENFSMSSEEAREFFRIMPTKR